MSAKVPTDLDIAIEVWQDLSVDEIKSAFRWFRVMQRDPEDSIREIWRLCKSYNTLVDSKKEDFHIKAFRIKWEDQGAETTMTMPAVFVNNKYLRQKVLESFYTGGKSPALICVQLQHEDQVFVSPREIQSYIILSAGKLFVEEDEYTGPIRSW